MIMCENKILIKVQYYEIMQKFIINLNIISKYGSRVNNSLMQYTRIEIKYKSNDVIDKIE